MLPCILLYALTSLHLPLYAPLYTACILLYIFTASDFWSVQVFLPLSSLAQIMPVSLARAKQCSERLLDSARTGEPIDMSAFCLHEAQAQLQLALLGLPEEFMDATNADLRRAFSLDPEAEPGTVFASLLR